MDDLTDALVAAWHMVAAGDAEIAAITLRTLLVSGAATALALLLGVPAGYLLARRQFRGRTFVTTLVHTGMGMPPVLVGLVIWLLVVRSGPLGDLDLAYTRTAMTVAQVVVALPVVTAFSCAAFAALPPGLTDLFTMLGAGRVRRLLLLAREARLGLLAAVMAAFGAVISEVGAAMTVGGNLAGETRVLTTAIVTETGRGRHDRALALGLVLLLLVLALNLGLTLLQQRERRT